MRRGTTPRDVESVRHESVLTWISRVEEGGESVGYRSCERKKGRTGQLWTAMDPLRGKYHGLKASTGVGSVDYGHSV